MGITKRIVSSNGKRDVEISNIQSALDSRLPSSIVQGSSAWAEITQKFTFSDSASLYWWNLGGAPLSVMFEAAGYDKQSQYIALVFFLQHIAHRLGPASLPSRQWKSYMTDDFSPLEFSWTWDYNKPPKLRYGCEPIGQFAGAQNDPFNQASTDALINELKGTNPEINFQVYDVLRSRLVLDRKDAHNPIGSSYMVVFEPWESSVSMKIYFVFSKPGQEAKITGVLGEAMNSLRDYDFQLKSLSLFSNYLSKNQSGNPARHLNFEFVAIDCVHPLESRLKIYMRSKETSFDALRHHLTLGEEVETTKPYRSYDWTPELLEQVKLFWQCCFGLEDDFSTSQSLSHAEHKFAGILYNFDVGEMYETPCTKFYIPIQHYLNDDAEIARRFGAFLEKMDGYGYFEEFMSGLQEICPHRPLKSESGMHTYFACGVKKGKLSLTTYVGTEIYNPARYN